MPLNTRTPSTIAPRTGPAAVAATGAESLPSAIRCLPIGGYRASIGRSACAGASMSGLAAWQPDRWLSTAPGRSEALPGAEMPNEERLGRVVLEHGHLDMAPGVDVEGLLLGADGIEESKTGVARDQLVVPLEEEQDRYPQGASRCLEVGPSHACPQAGQTEDSGLHVRLRGHEAQTDAGTHGHAPVAQSVVDEAAGEEILDQRSQLLYVGAHPAGESGRLVGVGDHWRPLTRPPVDAGLDGAPPGPCRLLVGDPLPMLGCVESDRRVALVTHEAPSQPEHFGSALVNHTSMAQDHCRSGSGGRLR